MEPLPETLDLANRYYQAGHFAEAEKQFRQALAIEPANTFALGGLGHAVWSQEKYAEARQAFETLVEVDPNDASARTNLGNVFRKLRMLAEAEAQQRAAVSLDPRMAIAHNNLGAVLAAQRRFAEAIACFNTAIELEPEFAQAHRNLAESLVGLGWLDEAAAAARRATQIDPSDAFAHADLAFCLTSLGRLDEAITSHRAAMAQDPGDAYGQSAYLYTLNFHPRYDPPTIFNEHVQWARRHAEPFTVRAAKHANDRSHDRRLRVGYVSAHFWDHAVSYFVEPILASHDHSACEVFCYSNDSRRDATTERLRSMADQWRDIADLDDDQASELVRQDRIDILVDLAGHIPGNRLLLFARRPAPVQVTYLGYQNTTGMTAMDYRLTDDWSDPPGTTERFHTEQLVRLPRSFFCYRPTPDAPPVSHLPALANGHITFGSFTYFAKITPEVLATWARLLKTVPRSRLVILPHTAHSLSEYLAAQFDQFGIAADRWTLEDRRPRGEYLDLIRQVDIALDPFPFIGHTTTCEALWQGVPVVTLVGETYARRFGASAHKNLGLDKLVTHSPSEYVETAARLAADLDKLRDLRYDLCERMNSSPLLDFAGFTRNLETAYRQMWIAWCEQ